MRLSPVAPLFVTLLSLEAWPIADVPIMGAAIAQVPSEAVVSDFSAPPLQGLSVRDHPQGAEIVTPARQAPWPVGEVITHVNGQPIRNATHFRDLMNELHRANARGVGVRTVSQVEAADAPGEQADAGSEWPRGLAARAHPNGVEITSPGPFALRTGDVITHVNGQAIHHGNLLQFRNLVVGAHRSGRRIDFTIHTASVVSDFSASWLRGLSVRDHPRGAEIVTPVGEGLLAQFRPGQVIVRVNNQPVVNAAHFRELMNGIPQVGIAETTLEVITPGSE
ncbi:MAG: hypothetical protein ACT4N8_05895 [Sphingosinicella sp.]|uniref:hypothetical protein n=1 Tax=Sphingosinicella sp. TaxID=1917971 RepID=UPI004037A51E